MPRELLNLYDYEARARGILPKAVFQRIDGGAFDEVTFRRTRKAILEPVLTTTNGTVLHQRVNVGTP